MGVWFGPLLYYRPLHKDQLIREVCSNTLFKQEFVSLHLIILGELGDTPPFLILLYFSS